MVATFPEEVVGPVNHFDEVQQVALWHCREAEERVEALLSSPSPCPETNPAEVGPRPLSSPGRPATGRVEGVRSRAPAYLGALGWSRAVLAPTGVPVPSGSQPTPTEDR